MDGAVYLPPSTAACPTYTDDSEWVPFVDGKAYLPELSRNLDTLESGDSLIVLGFEFDSRIDLDGHEPDDPEYRSLADRLVRLAADGVDIRIVLAGEHVAAILPVPALNGFRRNVHVSRLLQRLQAEDGSRPLSGRVLIDRSGPLLGSNHTKTVALVHGGVVTAFVGGIDLTDGRFDGDPHDTMRMRGRRYGWHDAVGRVRGPAAARVHETLAERWRLVAKRRTSLFARKRKRVERSAVPTVPVQPTIAGATPAVRVLRSMPARRVLPTLRRVPPVHEVYETLVTALSAARRYVYIEDQYLGEQAGGDHHFELYPFLRAAAARGAKIILVGSGVRDQDDPGLHLTAINRTINKDIQHKLIDRLEPGQRDNVVMYRVRRVTVHAKVVLVDDQFACVGSANMFSRSMGGTDRELSAAVVAPDTVRDLRVRIWAEHLRTELTDELRPSLEDLDLAFGMWKRSWSPVDDFWTSPGRPAGFAPAETALVPVPPRRSLWRQAQPD